MIVFIGEIIGSIFAVLYLSIPLILLGGVFWVIAQIFSLFKRKS